MAEEQRCQEGHQLCANNCGLLGSPATLNLCSKCYLHLHRLDAGTIHPSTAALTSPSSAASAALCLPETEVAAVRSPVKVIDEAVMPAQPLPPQVRNRCAGCRRKVGLMGFTCKCGATFCGTHRYPEQHACGYDFKTAGREAIARANPVVKAEKLRKI